MFGIHYNKLKDTINEFCDIDEPGYVDFISLSYNTVDEQTDMDDNLIPNLTEDCDITPLPEICGQVEVQFEDGHFKEKFNCIRKHCHPTKVPNSLVTKLSLLVTNEDICLTPITICTENYGLYDIFKEVFDENILLMIVKQSNLYARQKNNHIFNLTISQLKPFLVILLLYG